METVQQTRVVICAPLGSDEHSDGACLVGPELTHEGDVAIGAG